jgi:hypothetical protein
MKNFSVIMLIVLFLIGQAAPAYAQSPIFIGKIDEVGALYQRKARNAAKPIEDRDMQISYQLPGAQELTLKLNSSKREAASEVFFGEVKNSRNSNFYLKIEKGKASGAIILREEKKYYSYSSSPDGSIYLTEEDIDQVLCVGYDQVPMRTNPNASQAASVASAIPLRESLPGATAVLYLDFDGETVENTFWNYFNEDKPIEAAPAYLSEFEIVAVWEMMSEDFRPFDLNVTTSEAVFNKAPAGKRMRIIFTPTSEWFPNAGGVAYIGSFTWGEEGAYGEHPCWVFNSSIKGAGEAGSHEAGHTLYLGHDGRTSPEEEYYHGHDSWAPIMGVGYYYPVVQWSKGEYLNANNNEDDLAMISTLNGFGYRADDHGNDMATATPLVIDSDGYVSASKNRGVISTRADVDVFSFTTEGGPIELSVNPDPVYPNLDIILTLRDASGKVVVVSDPPSMSATVEATLGAGTYYLTVDGAKGTMGADSDYASLGSYSISTKDYCLPVYESGCTAFADLINNFSFNSLLNNNSGCGNGTSNAYTNYPASGNYTTTVSRGESYEVSMQSAEEPQYFGVWIDFNNDKDFDDEGEFVYASSYITTDKVTGTITIPNSAVLGEIRMRVRSTWSPQFTSGESCASRTWGEAEDYTITIVSGSNKAPEVSITSPESGASFKAPASVAIAATAIDDDGTVAKVEFFNGTQKLAEDTTAPYTYNWTGISPGTYSITAKATDNLGLATISAEVIIIVTEADSPNKAPTVNIITPSNGNKFNAPATIQITAHATDEDGTIAKVEFFESNRKLGEALSAPYSFTWTGVGEGKYRLTAKAIDNKGASATSKEVKIKVEAKQKDKKTLAFSEAGTANPETTAPALVLHQNYPNPFSHTTQVNFEVKENTITTLKVYNLLGQEVATLYNGPAQTGKVYEVAFEADKVMPGIYFYVLVNGVERSAKRMVIIMEK